MNHWPLVGSCYVDNCGKKSEYFVDLQISADDSDILEVCSDHLKQIETEEEIREGELNV